MWYWPWVYVYQRRRLCYECMGILVPGTQTVVLKVGYTCTRDKQELRDFREYGHRAPAEANAQERVLLRPPFLAAVLAL